MRTKTIASVLGVALVIAIPEAARAAPCSDGSHTKDPRAPHTANDEHVATNDDRVATMSDDDCIERDIHFMPGAFGVYYLPKGAAGAFAGGGVQIAPFQWSHNNDRFGPSQGSFYMQAALLQSPRSSGSMALFEAGATASFERNSSRRWLIPYFGATIGGMSQADLGTSVYTYPMGGVHLYWHRNLMLDAEGGYHFPFEDIDRTRGPRAQLTARFSLW